MTNAASFKTLAGRLLFGQFVQRDSAIDVSP
jgi:hypothetical protein